MGRGTGSLLSKCEMQQELQNNSEPHARPFSFVLTELHCWASQNTFTGIEGSLPQIPALVQGLNKKLFLEVILLGDRAQSSPHLPLKVHKRLLLFFGSSMRPRLGCPPLASGISAAMCIIHLKTRAGQGCCGQLTDQQITSLSALPLVLLLF